ncbi:proline-rich transmembrane 1-like [Paramuricea clavata]|uniref:Proline-rich transmembrane 1-like n=2 Tax=Paramuricea clavata TaxID=317549 RepID=A0A7D9DLJ1_PARCT|nr:proline-rich transmembrane 1-like [Paramuricea clavata]
MGLSIFACLCFFWPVGIFAIIKSLEARNRHMAGDYSGALTSAQTARYLAWGAILCGVILYVIIIAVESAK